MQRLVILLIAVLSAVSAFAPGASKMRSGVTMMAEKSQALPFMPMPPALVGVPNTNGKQYIMHAFIVHETLL